MRSKGLSILLVTLGVLLLGAAAILFVVRQAQDKQRAADIPSLIEKIEAALPERSAGVIENRADSAMAAVEIDGIDVIGLLELPGRGIKLPVSAEWDSSERCRYDSLFNFLFITHEGPPLQIAALPGGRWPGAAHLIPGKTKLKYLYLCIPC